MKQVDAVSEEEEPSVVASPSSNSLTLPWSSGTSHITSKPSDCRSVAASLAERNSVRHGEGPDSVIRLFEGVPVQTHHAACFAAGVG